MNFDKFKTKQTTQNQNITFKCEGNVISISSKDLNSLYFQNTMLGEYIQQPQIQERLKKHQIININFMPFQRLEILIEYVVNRVNGKQKFFITQEEREYTVKQLRMCKVSLTESLMYTDLSNESLTSEMWIRNCFFGDEDIAKIVIKHDTNRKVNAPFDFILRNCGIELIDNEWRASAEILSQHYCGMTLDESLEQMKLFYITQLKLGEIEFFACELMYKLDKKKEYRNEIEIAIGKYLIKKETLENNSNTSNDFANEQNKGIVKLIEYYSIDILLAKCKALVFMMDISVDHELFVKLLSDLYKPQFKYTKLDLKNNDLAAIKSLRINNQSLGIYQNIQYQNLSSQTNQQNGSNSNTNRNSINQMNSNNLHNPTNQNQQMNQHNQNSSPNQMNIQNPSKEIVEENEIIIIFIDHFMNVFGISMKVGSKFDNWMSPISMFTLQNTNKEPYTFIRSKKDMKVQRVTDGAFWNYVIEDCFWMRLVRPFSVGFGDLREYFDKKVKFDGNLFMGVSVGMIKDIFILE